MAGGTEQFAMIRLVGCPCPYIDNNSGCLQDELHCTRARTAGPN